jgi:hypothetical protein
VVVASSKVYVLPKKSLFGYDHYFQIFDAEIFIAGLIQYETACILMLYFTCSISMPTSHHWIMYMEEMDQSHSSWLSSVKIFLLGFFLVIF